MESKPTPAVLTTAYECRACGERATATYHDGCGGLVARIGSEWRCVECGTGIRPAETCFECGARVSVRAQPTPLDLRPDVSSRAVERALFDELVQRHLTPPCPTFDRALADIARAHSFEMAQESFVETETPGGTSLTDRCAGVGPLIGSSWANVARYAPESTTPRDIAAEIADYWTVSIRSDEADWTDGGVGVVPGPGGSVSVTAIIVERLGVTVSHPEQIERAIHDAINDRRRRHGLSTLSFDHHLSGIAREHSRDMAHRDFFEHETPEGRTVADRYRRGDYDTPPCAENISMQQCRVAEDHAEIAERIVDGWMNSPGHRENIVKPSWTTEGIGVYVDEETAVVYATQNFA